jgi:hypothetical protein
MIVVMIAEAAPASADDCVEGFGAGTGVTSCEKMCPSEPAIRRLKV